MKVSKTKVSELSEEVGFCAVLTLDYEENVDVENSCKIQKSITLYWRQT